MDDEESDRAIGAAREVTPRHQLLIAGTGRESTRATIEATKRAAGEGADAVLVRTPSYFKSQMTSDVFVAHYTAVADASPVPVLLYNVTVFTGVNLLPAAVARLAAHPNIAGMKESGGDIAQVGELVATTPERFQVLAGSATTLYAALSAGARGGILALACVVPELMVRMVDLVRQARHDEARTLQQHIATLAKLVTSVHGIPGLKAAAKLAGYPSGAPRPPLLAAAARGRRRDRARDGAGRTSHQRAGGADMTLPPLPPRILMGPGPCLIAPRVMRAMAAPVLSHLDPALMTLLDSMRDGLHRLFRAPDDAVALAVSGTGTSSMEAAIAALVDPSTRVTVVDHRLLRRSARRDVPPLRRHRLAAGGGVGPRGGSRRSHPRAQEDGCGRRGVRARRNLHRRAQSRTRAGRGGARARRAHAGRCRDDARRARAGHGGVEARRRVQLCAEVHRRALGTLAAGGSKERAPGERRLPQLLSGSRSHRRLLGAPQISPHAVVQPGLRPGRSASSPWKRRGSPGGGSVTSEITWRSRTASREWTWRCCHPKASGSGR